MEWASRHRSFITRWAIVVGVLLLGIDTALGAPTSFRQLSFLAAAAVLAPLAYYGVRMVLGLQLRLHGFSSFVQSGCRLCFYLFGLGSILAVPVAFHPSNSGLPAIAPFALFGAAALGALDTYVRGRIAGDDSKLAT